MSVLPLRVRMLRQVWKLKGLVVLVCSPLVLLPLALSTPEAACAYVITLMAVYWCTEVLPLAVTAMLPTVLFPALGIMESKDVCMQYLKDTNMLFVGGLMVAVAVEHWNLHKRIALRVLLLVGVQPALLMLGFMGVTAFLSMWISNTATTAMMVPIAQAVIHQLHGNSEKVSFAMELVKVHSKTVAVQQEPQQETITIEQSVNPNKDLNPTINLSKSEEVFDPDDIKSPGQEVRIGNPTANQEVIKPTPQDKPPSDISSPVVLTAENSNPGPQMQLEELSDEEEEKKRMRKGLLLCVCYAASIGGIATLTGTGPNLVLIGQMSQLFPQNGNVINFASWFAFAFPTMVLMLTLAWFWLQFLFVGCNFRRTWGCGLARSQKEKAAYDVIREEHRRMGPMSYGEISVLALFLLMVVLWFTRDPRFMDGWATHLFNTKAE
ncbi:hypothetical protein AMECASPLE_017299 [Ameca splendens]|uniref:Solute carrier family 13 (Sodium-dependent dicarboxylate transporter), member 2/3/5 n=1 Tax=Ameca splendens TaxID=208324 RepID=A0ABV1AAG4_9TELE